MDHIRPVARFCIALADIVIEQIVGGSRLVPFAADGQQSRRLIHHQDILVLMQDRQPFRLTLLNRTLVFAALLQFSFAFPRRGQLLLSAHFWPLYPPGKTADQYHLFVSRSDVHAL